MTLTAGLGTSRNFAGLFAEEVGGVRTIVAAKAYSEEVKGSKTVTASPSKETAGGKGVTKVKGAASIEAADAKVQAGKNYTLDGKEITIEAGAGITIKAGGKLTVKGSVKPKGSTLKFDASKTSKKSGSKVGS
jgi:hypothetical protein